MSPTDTPPLKKKTLKEGRSPIIQPRGQRTEWEEGERQGRMAQHRPWAQESEKSGAMSQLMSPPQPELPQSVRDRTERQMWVLWWGVRGLMRKEPLQLAEGQQGGSSESHQHLRKGTLEVSLRLGGGGSECHQHWVYPPPKPAGMLSAQCSICTENKGWRQGERERDIGAKGDVFSF